MTGEVFVTYLREVLLPTLRRGRVVVCDDLSAHRDPQVGPLVRGAGCRVVSLPAYSPDYNPIEERFSKAKNAVRKAEAREHEASVTAVGVALGTVTPRDAYGWFRHCHHRHCLPQPR